MTTTYEGMFLLDNQAVREDWNTAKALVTGTLEKHGGNVLTARHWDERKLSYPIAGRQRATYLLTYYTIDAPAIPPMRREFDLSERVLRYLSLKVDEVPEGEAKLSEAEQAADFTIPEPPPDDAPAEEEPEPETARRGEAERKSKDGEEQEAGGGKEGESKPGAEAKAESKPGAEAKAESGEPKAGEPEPKAGEPKADAGEPKAEAKPSEGASEGESEGTEKPKES